MAGGAAVRATVEITRVYGVRGVPPTRVRDATNHFRDGLGLEASFALAHVPCDGPALRVRLFELYAARRRSPHLPE